MEYTNNKLRKKKKQKLIHQYWKVIERETLQDYQVCLQKEKERQRQQQRPLLSDKEPMALDEEPKTVQQSSLPISILIEDLLHKDLLPN